MKKLIYILSLFVFVSCRLTHRLEHTVHRPLVNQPRQEVSTDTSMNISHYRLEDKEVLGYSHDGKQVRTLDEKTGKDILTVGLDEVLITARTKTVPERYGKVNVDFIVTVPKSLIDKRWMLTLTPFVSKPDEEIKLDDIVINGEIYKIYQSKGEGMYSALSDRYKFFQRDTSFIRKYFYNKYNLFYNKDARLDTIIESDKNFNYYYIQELSADENKKLNLFLQGNIFALDKSTYRLPLSDTITYFVSSMIQFIDHAPRYVQKVISRHAEANYSAHITFPVGKDIVDENLSDNASEIEKVRDIIHRLTWSSEFIIDSISMTATASPEGSWRANERLAIARAKALKNFFSKKLDDQQGVDTLLRSRWIAEDWQKLNDLIRSSNNFLQERDGILDIISAQSDPDIREIEIRKRYPNDYKLIKDSLFPALRVVDFKFSLRRSNMTKDTIHTTVLDTLYDRGRKLLEQRKYKAAQKILAEYNDYNTAICLMSLGYDKRAYEILQKEKTTANREYLLAVLLSRLGDENAAVEKFLQSCRMDISKVYRGALDPEINKLIVKYKLTNKLREYENA
jgi:hypothetical protein